MQGHSEFLAVRTNRRTVLAWAVAELLGAWSGNQSFAEVLTMNGTQFSNSKLQPVYPEVFQKFFDGAYAAAGV
jgi:hypothetical protein